VSGPNDSKTTATSTEQEVRRASRANGPAFDLDERERRRSVDVMLDYLNDSSRIVETFAMQALADFAEGGTKLRRKLLPLLKQLAQTGSPAMRARGRRSIIRLKGN
jgi:hypothetical protein